MKEDAARANAGRQAVTGIGCRKPERALSYHQVGTLLPSIFAIAASAV